MEMEIRKKIVTVGTSEGIILDKIVLYTLGLKLGDEIQVKIIGKFEN